MNGSKIPHSLRIIIFLLRLTLGLNFFYLGWSTLFDPSLTTTLGDRSLGDLYAWIGASAGHATSLQTFSAWAFLAIGGCLILGLLTRLAAILGIALTLVSYAPSVNLSALSPAQVANDGILVVICLLILIFSNAGEYIGLDTFIHVHLPGKRKK